MSNNSPSAGRLDSLKGQRSSLSGARPGSALKFKPKVVARRTKEERDADAPTIVPEVAHLPPRGNSGRERGNARGRGRGGIGGSNGRIPGTHVVSSGPLSSGFVSMDSKKTESRAGFSPSPTPDFIKNLRASSAARDMSPSVSTTKTLSSSDDEDEDRFIEGSETKINMSKEYEFDESATELFPVKALRTEHHDYGEAAPLPQMRNDPVVVKQDAETKVKAEDEGDVSMADIKADVDPAGTEQMSQEKSRLAEDHRRIHSLFSTGNGGATDVDGDVTMESQSGVTANEQGFFFFQLPRLLPEFKRPESSNKADSSEGDDDEDEEEEEEVEEVTELKAPQTEKKKKGDKLDGQIGTLRYHKSGKVTMKLGEIVFDVSRGGNSGFLQEVVHIDDGSSTGTEPQISHLGQILDKIVVTPKVD